MVILSKRWQEIVCEESKSIYTYVIEPFDIYNVPFASIDDLPADFIYDWSPERYWQISARVNLNAIVLGKTRPRYLIVAVSDSKEELAVKADLLGLAIKSLENLECYT